MKNWLNENTYIIADTHFGHKNIIKYEPIRTTIINKEIVNNDDLLLLSEEKIIENWNSVIKPEDHILHLGDFVLGGTTKIEEYTKKLNGHIHLILGNHDNGNNAVYKKNNINVINNIFYNKTVINVNNEYSSALITKIKNKIIMFSHIPILKDERHGARFFKANEELYDLFKKLKCDLNIHGHIHSISFDKNSKCINASLEVINFTPVKIKEILCRYFIDYDIGCGISHS